MFSAITLSSQTDSCWLGDTTYLKAWPVFHRVVLTKVVGLQLLNLYQLLYPVRLS